MKTLPLNNINFGKNTVYILDIDNTTVRTGAEARVKKNPKKELELLKLLDDSDVLVFNTGRPKSDINAILSYSLQDRASFLVTRLGSAIWDKAANGKWLPSKEWDEKLKATGFDMQKIQDTFHTLADKFRSQNKNNVFAEEYHEPFSSCVVLGSESPDVYLPFQKQVQETLEASGQRGFHLGHMAENNMSVVMATPEGATKGTASDFVISKILEKEPHIDKVLVAGDSKGDLTNFLINPPAQIKDTLFAFVNPKDKGFFREVLDGRKIPLPDSFAKRGTVAHGYYPSAKIFVPKGIVAAPKGLIESIKFFKAR